jgi:hypothetical protein
MKTVKGFSSIVKSKFQKTVLLSTLAVSTLSMSTGIVPVKIGSMENVQVAQAQSVQSTPTSWGELSFAVGQFWYSYYRRPWTQYYFGQYSPQQTSSIYARFGNQAPSQFNYGCRQAYYKAIGAPGWLRTATDPFAWFFFVSRYEGNRVNCFIRKFHN